MAGRIKRSSSSERGVREEPGNARDDHVAGALEVLADRRHIVPAFDVGRTCGQLTEVTAERDNDRRAFDIGRSGTSRPAPRDVDAVLP